MDAMDEQLLREVILDHYKSPRNWGELEGANAHAEGTNPLCGDEQSVDLRIEDGRIAAIRFRGHGCSISTAATSLLSESIEGKTIDEVVALGRDDMTELVGIQLSPVRLKCALLGLGVVKVALHRALGTALPETWPGSDEITWQ
jgi:nitrogen fixation NifU-like protein